MSPSSGPLLGQEQVVVLVPTFQRVDQLGVLLTALGQQSHPPARIVVCDNDVSQSARELCERHAVEYCAEGRPGVVAVRNALLDRVGDEAVFAFIDDDEIPTAQWLSTLVTTLLQESVDVVGGPVFPLHQPVADHWTVRHDAHAHGTRARGRDRRLYPSTNNCVVRVAAWRGAAAPRFDPAFGASGGEDTDFFWRLRRAGLSFFWEPDAAVQERVLSERLNTAWFIRRGMQNGWVHGTLQLRDHPAQVVVGNALLRIGAGGAQTVVALVRGRSFVPGVRRVLAGVGFLRAVVALAPSAYSRASGRGS